MTKARTVGQKRRHRHHLPEDDATLVHVAEKQARRIRDNTPTIEARAQGSYTESDTGTFTNGASTYLGKLELRGAITPRQRKGGEAFADCYRLAWSISGKDSCVLRVGGVGHETASQAERHIARMAKLDRVKRRVSREQFGNLLVIAVFEFVALGRNRTEWERQRRVSFCSSLDVCADVFDVPA